MVEFVHSHIFLHCTVTRYPEPMNRRVFAISFGLLIAGVLIAGISKTSAESRAFQANLDGAAMGYQWDIQPDYTGLWVGVVIAAVGAVGMLMALLRGNEKKTPADQ